MNANVLPTGTASGEPRRGSSQPQKPPPPFEFATRRQSILGAFARRTWQILSLCLVISMPLVYLIYAIIEPTYEAVSRIRTEPFQPDLYDTSRQLTDGDVRASEAYLQTQVNLIRTDRVLDRAIASLSAINLPMIRDSEDPKTDVREKMVVEIEPGTYIIRVALESKDKNEAAAIVNAVVDSYLEENLRYTQTRDATLKASLTEQVASLKEQIEGKKTELHDLHQKGNVQNHKPALNRNLEISETDGVEPTFDSLDEKHLNAIIGAMVQVDLDLLAARAELKSMREASNEERNNNRVEGAIEEAFLADSDVIKVNNQINEFREQLKRPNQSPRESNDPARQATQKQLDKLTKEYNALWAVKADDLRNRLRSAAGRPSRVNAIDELKLKVKILQGKKENYARMYQKLKVEQKVTDSDPFRFTYATQELTSLLQREDQVKRTLAQIEFQSRQESYRVVLVDKAQVPQVAANHNRWKYMAAAPLAILLLLVGGFLVSEISGRRTSRTIFARSIESPVPPARRETADGSYKIADLAYACWRARGSQTV